MALVDEMIEKGSEFSLRGTDDELDMRSAVEASLGYEDLGAAEQDMRIRCGEDSIDGHVTASCRVYAEHCQQHSTSGWQGR